MEIGKWKLMSARRKQTSHVDCANMSFNLPCPYKGNHKENSIFSVTKMSKVYRRNFNLPSRFDFNLLEFQFTIRAREIETHVRE